MIQSTYSTLRMYASRRLRREAPGLTLEATALVHEVYLRLDAVGSRTWSSEEEFLAAAAVTARRVLVDSARRRLAAKRGGQRPVSLDDPGMVGDPRSWEELLAIDEAMERLSSVDPRRGRVAELRVFGGLTNEEAATALSVPRATVALDWAAARAWLTLQLRGGDLG